MITMKKETKKKVTRNVKVKQESYYSIRVYINKKWKTYFKKDANSALQLNSLLVSKNCFSYIEQNSL